MVDCFNTLLNNLRGLCENLGCNLCFYSFFLSQKMELRTSKLVTTKNQLISVCNGECKKTSQDLFSVNSKVYCSLAFVSSLTLLVLFSIESSYSFEFFTFIQLHHFFPQKFIFWKTFCCSWFLFSCVFVAFAFFIWNAWRDSFEDRLVLLLTNLTLFSDFIFLKRKIYYKINVIQQIQNLVLLF